LCVRFASEDLRDPIIKDNILDDVVLQEHIEKNRLNEWYPAAGRAGKAAHDAAKREQLQMQQQQALAVDVDYDAASDQAGDAEVIEADMIEAAGFEGDVESGADVEMQES
jgi:nuclear pore complex protein Nup133